MHINLHRDDLVTLIQMLDSLSNHTPTDAGYITLRKTNECGIGYCAEAEVDVDLNGLKGKFVKTIIGSDRW